MILTRSNLLNYLRYPPLANKLVVVEYFVDKIIKYLLNRSHVCVPLIRQLFEVREWTTRAIE